jgi:glutamate synthase domain-containing protein 1
MCGIVGLFIKNPELEPQLGRWLSVMLEEMTSRGPDSAGFALYGAPASNGLKATLRAPSAQRAGEVAGQLRQQLQAVTTLRDTHVVVSVTENDLPALHQALVTDCADLELVGLGQRMEIYKEVGLPSQISARFELASMAGTHAIGHTRMATESAVTTDGAHPFSTGQDQCLVHNGSLSNHNRLRDVLRRKGLTIETMNDTEVGAAYLSWCMREGMSLGEALQRCLTDLDGFYTFVVGTENGFGVLRDPIACKPAVMAETDDYVAFGSEYRALSALPGIADARLFEPEPATVYFWERD